MKRNAINRRDFIKTSVSAALAVTSLAPAALPRDAAGYDAKGLPTRRFGKTGVRIPPIVFGGGSRFCTVKEPEKSVEILTRALDAGFYYWDTAHEYVYGGVSSEERFGLVLRDRRDEVFLATKLDDRTADGARREFEESLRRLKTDRVDLLQIHLIASPADVDRIGAKGGVLEALHKIRDEKAARFIGFSGHLDAEAMAEAARCYDFDTMLIALNHHAAGQEFEGRAVPAAAKKDMGILVMKAIRPRETVLGIDVEKLIRYALSLELVSAAVIGIDGLDVLEKNIRIARTFKKMAPDEMREMTARLRPFYRSRDLEWLNPAYRDGAPI